MLDTLSFNGNLKGPSGKPQHQWTAPLPQSKTGGPNWQAPPTSRTSIPQPGVQTGLMGAAQPPLQQPAGFRPPFAAQPMGQPFMVCKILNYFVSIKFVSSTSSLVVLHLCNF